MSDGSIAYPVSTRKREPDPAEIIPWGNHAIYVHHYYDRNAIKLFTHLVLYLQQRFNVIFVLIPYNPLVYDSQLQPFTTAITLIEPIVHQIAKSVGVQVIGSYNPHNIGCKADEFWDAIHPKPKCTMKLETLSVQYKANNKKQIFSKLEDRHTVAN